MKTVDTFVIFAMNPFFITFYVTGLVFILIPPITTVFACAFTLSNKVKIEIKRF